MSNDVAFQFARESLMAFACLQWSGYKPAAHHLLIAKYLEKVERGEINRLIIQSPPRSGKSMIVSQYFPAWFLGKNPDKRIACASYAQELASDFGRSVRNQFADPLFETIFPGVKLSEDSAAVDKFDVAAPHRGGYVAVGVGGALTGRGAHCFVGETLIATEVGPLRIDALIDWPEPIKVWSYNHVRDRLEIKRVVASQVSTADELIEIHTVGGRRLRVTPDHPIWCRERGYQPAEAMGTGYGIKTRGAGTVLDDSITAVRKAEAPGEWVYDIQVEGNNNLFADGILCHNCLLIDDPIKGRDDSDSEANSRRLKDWFTSVAYTRLMDDGAIIICQTRWSTNDLAGWVQKEHAHENWVVLNLPAINDKGEALWPEKFPLKVLNKIKKTLPARDWEALYQQRPFAPEGGIYKRVWWNKYPEGKAAPECSFILMSFDTAFSDADRKRSSYTACVVIGVFQRPDDECAQLFLIDAWKKRMEYPELRSEVIRMHRDHKPDKLIIEKKASGISIIQDLRRTGIPITTYTPGTDKITRAYTASGLVENGRCYYPDRRWASEFIDALARFPSPEDDDLADAFSQALIWLGNSLMVSYSQDAERRKIEDAEDQDDDEDDDFLPSNVRRLKPKKRAAYA